MPSLFRHLRIAHSCGRSPPRSRPTRVRLTAFHSATSPSLRGRRSWPPRPPAAAHGSGSGTAYNRLSRRRASLFVSVSVSVRCLLGAPSRVAPFRCGRCPAIASMTGLNVISSLLASRSQALPPRARVPSHVDGAGRPADRPYASLLAAARSH